MSTRPFTPLLRNSSVMATTLSVVASDISSESSTKTNSSAPKLTLDPSPRTAMVPLPSSRRVLPVERRTHPDACLLKALAHRAGDGRRVRPVTVHTQRLHAERHGPP